MASRAFAILAPVVAILAAFFIGGIFIALIGENPLEIYGKMLERTLGTPYGFGQTLYRATPLVLTGLAVAIPFQAGLFNIGGEGQALVGTFACALVGAFLPPSTPSPFAIAICLSVAAIAGGAWGAIAGALRARFGVSEVITTIMLNFIASAIVGYLLTNRFAVPATTHTPEIIESARLARLDEFGGLFHRAPVNVALFLSLAVAAGAHFFVFKTKSGYELRAIGFNAEAARYAGINVNAHVFGSMTLAGALAGLVAANYVMGYKCYYEFGATSGVGFLGIAVAMLANSHPAWIALSAFLFGTLDYGGLTINAYVPKEIFLVIQALVILFIIVAQKFKGDAIFAK
ncbi:MAG: ABC transporter permease [Chloroherpetonaceae bacterium]|nr:ABC transporter permease [Chloroherpetonaceae bacterium]MDW8438359.1 ABC transporter permease [Chloroherpetonaceae bacterium]